MTQNFVQCSISILRLGSRKKMKIFFLSTFFSLFVCFSEKAPLFFNNKIWANVYRFFIETFHFPPLPQGSLLFLANTFIVLHLSMSRLFVSKFRPFRTLICPKLKVTCETLWSMLFVTLVRWIEVVWQFWFEIKLYIPN